MADVGAATGEEERQDKGATPLSDQSAGKPVPFTDVYRDRVAFVWRALRRLGVRAADAEDACQDVFIVVHSKLDLFDWSRSLDAWILGISLKVAAKYRRRAHVKRETLMDAPIAITEPEGVVGLEREQAKKILEVILDGLNDKQRDVFVLYELQEQPMTAVAELLDVPLQTAYSRLHAARKNVETQIRRLQSTGQEGAPDGS